MWFECRFYVQSIAQMYENFCVLHAVNHAQTLAFSCEITGIVPDPGCGIRIPGADQERFFFRLSVFNHNIGSGPLNQVTGNFQTECMIHTKRHLRLLYTT
jgi:hypothetical protein